MLLVRRLDTDRHAIQFVLGRRFIRHFETNVTMIDLDFAVQVITPEFLEPVTLLDVVTDHNEGKLRHVNALACELCMLEHKSIFARAIEHDVDRVCTAEFPHDIADRADNFRSAVSRAELHIARNRNSQVIDQPNTKS